MRNYIPKWLWRPISLPQPAAEVATLALKRAILRWEGTPYMPGQQVAGAGVDCVRFICKIFDELHGLSATPLKIIPADTSLHDRAGAVAAMRSILRGYEPIDIVLGGVVEPGDVVVIGPTRGGPGHGLIVGFEPNTLWHAAPSGVSRTGFGFAEGYQRIFKVFRKGGRESWGASR